MKKNKEARDFLEQVRKLDKMIENKMYEKLHWKDAAVVITASLGGEKVQTSGSKQKMADSVCRYTDLEREIDECIDNLVNTKKDVISVIEQLNAEEYDVLHKVYVQYLTFSDVADANDKSYSWVASMHGIALNKVQKILDNRKCETL